MAAIKAEKRKFTLFTGKALFLLIAPIVIESIFSTSLGFFDSMMVSSITEIGSSGEAIASGNAGNAVSNVDQINNLIIQLFSAFGTGGAIITSQYLGAKRVEEANKSAKQMVVLVFLASIVIAVLCLALNDPLLKLFYGGVNQKTFEYSREYFYLTAASFPFIGLFNACAALLRAQRKSMFTMISAGISCLLNVGFNALFLYVLEMKVIGAGLATLICRAVPAVYMLALLTRKSYTVHIRIWEKFRFDGKMLKKILHLAVPSGIESCLFQLGKLMTNTFVNISFYNAPVLDAAGNAVFDGAGNPILSNVQANGNSIASNINGIASVVGGGVGTSALTVVGQAVGTGDVDQAKYYMKKMFLISYLANAVAVALILGTSQWLVLLYDYPAEARAIALRCLYLCLSFQIVTYPLSFTTPAILKATSDVKYVMYSAIASMLVMRVGLCFILTTDLLPFRIGALGFWIAMCADWVCRSVLFVARLVSGRWKKASGLLNGRPLAATAGAGVADNGAAGNFVAGNGSNNGTGDGADNGAESCTTAGIGAGGGSVNGADNGAAGNFVAGNGSNNGTGDGADNGSNNGADNGAESCTTAGIGAGGGSVNGAGSTSGGAAEQEAAPDESTDDTEDG